MQFWQFKVRDLPENRNAANQFQVSATGVGLEVEDAQVVSPIQVNVVLFRTELDVFVDMEIRTEVETECRLCLAVIRTPLLATFSARYGLAKDPARLEDPFVEIGLRHYAGDYLDLAEDIRESLILELPLWSVCSEDCLGLCPTCGINRNEQSCDCDETVLRGGKFSTLASLLDK